MAKGTIRRLVADRGFGFIKGEGEGGLFLKRNDIQGVGYKLHILMPLCIIHCFGV